MTYYVMPDGTIVFTAKEAQEYDYEGYLKSGEAK